MATLPAKGTISYNGYTWPVETKTVSIDARPEYDAAGRTVIYVEYTITLEWKVIAAAGETIESTIADIRRKLQAPGGAFTYQNKGFGDLIVNVSGAKDVVWGPKPKILTFYNPREQRACTLRWICTVAIPECSSATYAFHPLAFNYRAEFNVDRSGYTQRTISGYIQIPQTRASQATRTLSDHVDRYYENCVPAVPEGFRRVTSRRTISENKCRLDFTFTDEEMPVPLPPGVIDVQASESRQTVRPASFVQWAGTISASYELAKSVRADAKIAAFDHFIHAIVNPRLAAVSQVGRARVLRAGGGVPGFPPPARIADVSGTTPIPMHLHIEEPEIYGRQTARFTFTYTVACAQPHFLTDGLWQPVPGTNDRLWKQSVANILGPRGIAGLVMLASEDVIIDLCSTQSTRVLRASKPTRPPQSTSPVRLVRSQCPPPDSSWIDYWCRLRIEVNGKVIEHKPLPETTLRVLKRSATGEPVVGNFDGKLEAGSLLISKSNVESIFQQQGIPTIEIILYGAATRACYEVVPPELRSFGGRSVVPANDSRRGDHFETWVEANAGLPVFKARWQMRWKVVAPPQTRVLAAAPPNPRAPTSTVTLRRDPGKPTPAP